MRPFSRLAPNKSSSDRTKDLKAKTLFKNEKKNFQRSNCSRKVASFNKDGTLASVPSKEMKLLLSRGYALCEDGVCYELKDSCDISGTCIAKRGLINCKGPFPKAAKIDTNTNLFTHFVKQYLPYNAKKHFPLIVGYDISDNSVATGGHVVGGDEGNEWYLGDLGLYKANGLYENGDDLLLDPNGLFLSPCLDSGSGDLNNEARLNRNYDKTTILGQNDINGKYKVFQGTKCINLSWGNKTKQSYLASYDPKGKIKFNINPALSKIHDCDIN